MIKKDNKMPPAFEIWLYFEVCYRFFCVGGGPTSPGFPCRSLGAPSNNGKLHSEVGQFKVGYPDHSKCVVSIFGPLADPLFVVLG